MEHPGLLSLSLHGAAGPWIPVYVVTPKHGEDWEHARDSQDGSVYEPQFTVRRVDGARWALNYYGDL
jgi:hypothetical protein